MEEIREIIVTEEKWFFFRGYNIPVLFVPRSELYPGSFGCALGHARSKDGALAKVRDNLHPWVKRFVVKHELYHLTDKWTWGGFFGREFRASFFPGLTDPIGLLATIAASCNRERIGFYIKRIRERR